MGNGIIGDNTMVDVAETQVDKQTLDNEKKLAKYAQSAEFKRFKAHMQERIKFYQEFLPDGSPVATSKLKEREGMWAIANTVVAEFNAVIGVYESAAEVVKDATRDK